MKANLQKVTSEALALAEEERRLLLQALSSSLDLPEPVCDEELRLRIEAVESGNEHPLAHHEVMENARNLIL